MVRIWTGPISGFWGEGGCNYGFSCDESMELPIASSALLPTGFIGSEEIWLVCSKCKTGYLSNQFKSSPLLKTCLSAAFKMDMWNNVYHFPLFNVLATFKKGRVIKGTLKVSFPQRQANKKHMDTKQHRNAQREKQKGCSLQQSCVRCQLYLLKHQTIRHLP